MPTRADNHRAAARRAVIMTGAASLSAWDRTLRKTEKFQSGHEGANWFQSWQDFITRTAASISRAELPLRQAWRSRPCVGYPGVRMGC